MLSIIQNMILAYIKKYGTVNFEEIQEIVNEPLVLLAKEFKRLYNDKYIEKIDDKFKITDKAKNDNIGEWDFWIDEWNPNDFFNTDTKLDFEINEKGYPNIHDKKDLDKLLQLKYVNRSAYHVFLLCTKNKTREIMAPSLKLKQRQRWILNNILERYILPDCVHGFAKGKSIVTNALCHVNQKEIACIDIENFFPSISEKVVYKIFQDLGYENKVAMELSKLCTYDGVLPQGAPTSPMLANIALRELDSNMQKYAEYNNLNYSRYADDLTLSGNCDITQHLNRMIQEVEKCGYRVNNNKTHIMKDNYRKIVTGLVVNETVKVPKNYKRLFRQEIYYCKKLGIEQHLKNTGRESAVNFREYMYGKAYFIKMVEPENGTRLLKELDDIFDLYV